MEQMFANREPQLVVQHHKTRIELIIHHDPQTAVQKANARTAELESVGTQVEPHIVDLYSIALIVQESWVYDESVGESMPAFEYHQARYKQDQLTRQAMIAQAEEHVRQQMGQVGGEPVPDAIPEDRLEPPQTMEDLRAAREQAERDAGPNPV